MTNPYSPPQRSGRRIPALRASSVNALLLWTILGAAVGLITMQALDCLQVRHVRWNGSLPLNILWCSFGGIVGMGGLAHWTGGTEGNVGKAVVINVAGSVVVFWLTDLSCHLYYFLSAGDLPLSFSRWKIPFFCSAVFSLLMFVRCSVISETGTLWRVTFGVMSTVPTSILFWLLYGGQYVAPSLLINICFGPSLLMFSLTIFYDWKLRSLDFWRLCPWGVGVCAFLAILYLSLFGVST